MNTKHNYYIGNSENMEDVVDETVQLVVTSPPYPMIDIWDEMFSEQDPMIETALKLGLGNEAFERMHAVLDTVWEEVKRVTEASGIVCINVGDATRKLDKTFQCYPNAARITMWFMENGFTVLPQVHWRKPTNKANKFMGSGMLPPNAYVTQEEESILIFRKGPHTRGLTERVARNNRWESTYFYEERNKWFSDSWDDIPGSRQDGLHNSRKRLALYPMELPLRLISMYSVYGDTVLDPFAGTGTTSIAAMALGRNSVAYDIDPAMKKLFRKQVINVRETNRDFIRRRIHGHYKFVKETDREFKHHNELYDFPVTTKAETTMKLYTVDKVKGSNGEWTVSYNNYDGSIAPV